MRRFVVLLCNVLCLCSEASLGNQVALAAASTLCIGITVLLPSSSARSDLLLSLLKGGHTLPTTAQGAELLAEQLCLRYVCVAGTRVVHCACGDASAVVCAVVVADGHSDLFLVMCIPGCSRVHASICSCVCLCVCGG